MSYDLSVLTTRQLTELGKRLNGGTFGKDPEQLKKTEKIEHIWSLAMNSTGDVDSASKLVAQAAKSVLAGVSPGEGGDNPVDHTDVLVTGNDAPPGDAKQSQAEGASGFGFDGQGPDGKSECEHHGGPDHQNCQFPGAPCPTFPETGTCKECGVPFANAVAHMPHKNEDGKTELCPVEQRLVDWHEKSESGVGKPDMSMDLLTLIKAVTHDEHDPVFLEVGKALHRAEKIVGQVGAMSAQAKSDAEAALDLVKEARKKRVQAAEKITIEWPNLPPCEIIGEHPVIFPKLMGLMALADPIRQPVALVGPAGSGKTTIFEHATKALFGEKWHEQYGAVSCSADMTSGKVNGRILPIGTGVYVPSDLVRLMTSEKPFMYVYDEYDAAPSEIIVGANTLLANDAAYIEERSFAGLPVRIVKPSGSRFGACLNTFGTGPDALYVARSQQDAASMDRWLILYMDENPAVPASILGAKFSPLDVWIPMVRTEDELREAFRVAHDFIVKVKHRVLKVGLKRVVSARMALRARATLTAGFTWEETQDVLLAGWTKDEKAQVMSA